MRAACAACGDSGFTGKNEPPQTECNITNIIGRSSLTLIVATIGPSLTILWIFANYSILPLGVVIPY